MDMNAVALMLTALATIILAVFAVVNWMSTKNLVLYANKSFELSLSLNKVNIAVRPQISINETERVLNVSDHWKKPGENQ